VESQGEKEPDDWDQAQGESIMLLCTGRCDIHFREKTRKDKGIDSRDSSRV